MTSGRPWVTVKAATSLDGRIAAAEGQRTALTSTPANLHVQYGRAVVDAIAVGVGTVLVDDPLLTARDVYRDRPLTRVVFDRQLRTPPEAKLFTTLSAGPVVVVTHGTPAGEAADRVSRLLDVGATVVTAPEAGLASALECLPALDVHSIEIEGGAECTPRRGTKASWIAVQIYVAPVWLGAAGVPLSRAGVPG